MTDSLQILSSEQREIVENISAQFEAAWQAGSQPSIDDHLPDDQRVRQAALVELVHAELEFRLKDGQVARVEEYLKRFPELALQPDTTVDLLVTEYRQRQRREIGVDVDSYLKRFPEYEQLLSGRLEPETETSPDAAVTQMTAATIGYSGNTISQQRSLTGGSQEFGNYTLLEEIARGGMGVVYRARDEKLGRIVALKMILSGQLAGEEELQRFQTEARAAAQLQHPNIVAIHEVGEVDGQHFFSMDYVEGENLAQWLSRELPPARRAVECVKQMAVAIGYAHDEGVLHRDLKPQNVLVDRGNQLRITDFGLAKQLADDSGVTGTGQALGTPSYMPPEQAGSNPEEIGPPSDIYSLGAVLYELLTGRPPFKSRTPLDTLLQVLNQEPVAPRILDAKIDRDLETITLKCLEKQPERRYQSALHFGEDLDAWLNHRPIAARPVGALGKLARWTRRSPSVAILSATLLVLLVAGTVVSSSLAIWAVGQRDRANQQADDAADARDRAEGETEKAAQSKELVERQAYNFNVKMIPGNWDAGEVQRVWRLFEQELGTASTSPGSEKFRGFEWGYFQRLSRLELLTMRPHEEGVTSVAFSPDGRWVASGSLDQSVKVSHAGTGQEVFTLSGHEREVTSVAFSPQGNRLASASGDQTVKVWDLVTGQTLITLAGHDLGTQSVGFSPDGKQLVTGGWDDRVKLWDVSTGREILNLSGHTDAVWSVAFSPDGKRIASGSQDKSVKLWDASTGERLLALNGHTEKVTCVAFSPDGKWLASGSEDYTLRLWEATTGTAQRTLTKHTDGVTSVAFSPDSRWIASASVDGTVKLWDMEAALQKIFSQKELLTLKGHTLQVNSAAFSPDGLRLVSASADQTVKVWDITRGAESFAAQIHSESVLGVAFTPDGTRIVSTSSDGTVKLSDSVTGVELLTLGERTDGLSLVAIRPHSQQIATGSEDGGTVTLWDTVTGDKLLNLIGHEDGITSLDFSPDGTRIATASYDASVKLWDAETGAEILSFSRETDFVARVVFSPDGKRLATVHDDGKIRLWDAETGEMVLTLKGELAYVTTLAFNPDNQSLVTAGDDEVVRVWDANTGESVGSLEAVGSLEGEFGAPSSLVFSPDGQRFAASGESGKVKLWDAVTGFELFTLGKGTERFASVAFSPDGQRIAVGTEEATVIVWDGRPVTAESRAERWAVGYLNFWFERLGKKREVLAKLRKDPTIPEDVRERALILIERYREQSRLPDSEMPGK